MQLSEAVPTENGQGPSWVQSPSKTKLKKMNLVDPNTIHMYLKIIYVYNMHEYILRHVCTYNGLFTQGPILKTFASSWRFCKVTLELSHVVGKPGSSLVALSLVNQVL